MEIILSITSDNKDQKNFTRTFDVTPDEYDYLVKCVGAINKGGNHFMGVYVSKI